MSNIHTVGKGENLYKIAKANKTTVQELLKLNPNLKKNGSLIFVGDKINLPASKPEDIDMNVKGLSIERTSPQPKTEKPKTTPDAKNTPTPKTTVYKTTQAPVKPAVKQQVSTPQAPNRNSTSKNTENLILQEMQKRGLKNVDIQYWESKIDNVSSQFDIPKEILVSIISRETKFEKNSNSGNGKGAMQQTSIAIRDFFPAGQANWADLYKSIDSKLFNDIVYKKDQNGNLIKDKNGNPVLKYKSANELHQTCARDDELSIKVGALLFKMQYAKSIAEEKYGKATYANVPKVINQLKSGKISLENNYKYIANAIKNYNGHPKYMNNYRTDVVDSLKRQHYNFQQPIIRRA